MTTTSQNEKDIRQPLRYMQWAALAGIVVIAAVLYTFSRNSDAPVVNEEVPVVTISDTYRLKLPQFEWVNRASKLSTADLTGGWTLLTFWSLTCAPCLEEMPELDELSDDWSGPPMKIITINVDPDSPESIDSVQQFLADNEIQLPVLYDPRGELEKPFDVHEIPRHFFINPAGEIVWQAKGAFRWTAPESEKALLTLMEREKAEPASTQ